MTDRHDPQEPREPDDGVAVDDVDDAAVAARPDGGAADDVRDDDADAQAEVDDEIDDDEPAERTERRSDVVIVTLVFVVLFAYQLYSAISNLVGLPQVYDEIGISESVPWAVLYAGVAVPAVAFAAASAVARGRRLAARAGILLLGLGVSAQLSLLLEELARRAAIAAFGG